MEQAEWVTTISFLTSLSYERQAPCPEDKVRAVCWVIATHPAFEFFIYSVIAMNVIEMCFWWYGMPERILSVKDDFNKFVFAAFLVGLSHSHMRPVWVNRFLG